MPSKKQIRRQQKLKRHQYEEVYVDDAGRELDPEEVRELIGSSPKAANAAKRKPSGRQPRTIEPPSMRRTLKRGLLFFPLMLITVILLGKNLTLAKQITQTIVLMAFFLPFSYFMDTMMFRAYQRRLGKVLDEGKRR